MTNKVIALRGVTLGVRDLQRTAMFYAQAWGLEAVLQRDSFALFRATGTEHHVLRLEQQAKAGLSGVELAAADSEAVDWLHREACSHGHAVLSPPRALPADEGGGYGLDLATPDGLRVAISADRARHPELATDKSRPRKLTHVVINSPNVKIQVDWFMDFLGFRLSDRTRTQVFLRCDADHHSIAFGESDQPSLNHAAFEIADIDGVMYGAGRMIDHGYEVQWGLGRHGPGSNVFNYFVDPEGFAIEYTTEVEQIDEASYVAHDAAYWTAFPRRPCRWGVAWKPSDRLVRAFGGKGLDGSES